LENISTSNYNEQIKHQNTHSSLYNLFVPAWMHLILYKFYIKGCQQQCNQRFTVLHKIKIPIYSLFLHWITDTINLRPLILRCSTSRVVLIHLIQLNFFLGSNMSLNSDESSPRGGSSVRRTSSMRSGGGAPGRVSASGTPIRRVEPPTPVGFGSSAPRKMSSPYTNGRTPSTSSTDRTPMAGR
jgi:hypothetical protein